MIPIVKERHGQTIVYEWMVIVRDGKTIREINYNMPTCWVPLVGEHGHKEYAADPKASLEIPVKIEDTIGLAELAELVFGKTIDGRHKGDRPKHAACEGVASSSRILTAINSAA